jgi:hypothetical protein
MSSEGSTQPITRQNGLLMFGEVEERVNTRSAGITAVAPIFLGYAIIAAISALLLAAERVSMSSGAWLIGGGFEIMGKWIFALDALTHAACAFGLWRRQRWALRVASILLLWGFFQVIPALSSATADSRVCAIAREEYKSSGALPLCATSGRSLPARPSHPESRKMPILTTTPEQGNRFPIF